MPLKKHPIPFPTLEELRAFIAEQPHPMNRREIVRAFGIKDDDRIALKALLRQLKEEEAPPRGEPSDNTALIEISSIDDEGRAIGYPVEWKHASPRPPVIVQHHSPKTKRRHISLAPGDRCIVRLHHQGKDRYFGQWIRDVKKKQGEIVLGQFQTSSNGAWIIPTAKKANVRFRVSPKTLGDAHDGDLVLAEIMKSSRLSQTEAAVAKIVMRKEDMTHLSLIAIHEQQLPTEFSSEAIAIAAKAALPPVQGREDLRSIPFVTIDDEDARDFDDAVWASMDTDPENPGGWYAIVAIADVSYYVRTEDVLDREARERGNSVYFPDQVVPMLPEALSNEMCSLKPNEDRACLAVHMWFDNTGHLKEYRFVRGLMRSCARLTYSIAHKAYEGEKTDLSGDFIKTIVHPLYGIYHVLTKARQARGALDFDMPERRVYLDKNNRITDIATRPRFDSHRLIEEFMIAANVAAATALEEAHHPCIYRVHDRPDPVRVANLRYFLKGTNLSFPKSSDVKPKDFNALLRQAEQTRYGDVIQDLILRTQAQAEYSPHNSGHYGLGLQRYCHFTSPIRRYADLLVHRDLIAALKLGEGGTHIDDTRQYRDIATHISFTERRATAAERDTLDRYLAAYLKDQTGATFTGRITGVIKFGLFITLDAYAATGFVPVRTLPLGPYHFDEWNHQLSSRRGHIHYRLGEIVEVRLMKAEPFTGGLEFQLAHPKFETEPRNLKAKKKKGNSPGRLN